MPLDSRTRAILRRAEFGFFGVIVRTTVQTPRFWGAPFWSLVCRPVSEFHAVRRAGVSTFFFCVFRPLRTSCEIVGTVTPYMYVPGGRTRTHPCGPAVCDLDSPDRKAAPREVGSRAQRGRSHKIATGSMREKWPPRRPLRSKDADCEVYGRFQVKVNRTLCMPWPRRPSDSILRFAT